MGVESVFSVDNWLGVGLLYRIFPRLFPLASNKRSNVKECFVGRGGLESCDLSFGRVLCSSEKSRVFIEYFF